MAAARRGHDIVVLALDAGDDAVPDEVLIDLAAGAFEAFSSTGGS